MLGAQDVRMDQLKRDQQQGGVVDLRGYPGGRHGVPPATAKALLRIAVVFFRAEIQVHRGTGG